MTEGTLPVGHVGLTDAEAKALLDAEGPNQLPAASHPSTLWRFGKELVHFFALMLWMAAVLAWIAGLRLGWTTNRLLIPATSIELVFSLLVLFVDPIARELEHANPPLAGWAVALASIPLVLAVDSLDKHRRQRRRSRPDS